MTKTEKKKLIPKIVVGSYILDEYEKYKVVRVKKDGVQCIRDWNNFAGYFYEYVFISFDELYSNDWKMIIE